ncbi:methionyl-tRNA formyltransferase [Rothia halotolerans]|uniref:methionyl-tRNA formyltransferase n=1 Tax=Rothia halotolerans TaxID=405770 RepID=UPI00101CC082|nr:methionyl-tRNA formyltransferase [Rothia halotolerans]
MRVLYAGTPEIAVAPLEALIEAGHDVVGVLTRPDAPLGRKRVLTPSPVAARAEELGLPVIRAHRYDDEAHAAVLRLAPEAAAVVAYGALLPRRALEAVPHGWINLHFSRLPAWRGAAPVQRALMAGETVLWASTFLIEEGMDTGPVFDVLSEPVGPEDTAGTMLRRLAVSGGRMLAGTLGEIEAGTARPRPQEGEPTRAAKLVLEDGRVDWARPAAGIEAQARGATPEPGLWTTLEGQRVKLAGLRAAPPEDDDDAARVPGEARLAGREVRVRAADGDVVVARIQPAGKKMMDAADWARGAGRLTHGSVRFA